MSLATILLCGVAAADAQGQTPAPGRELPDLPPQRSSATKLAGLAGFVNMSCDAIRTDKERFRSVIEALGVKLEDLEHGELRLRAQTYIETYNRDAASSCRQADAMFGRSGTVVAGVFVPR